MIFGKYLSKDNKEELAEIDFFVSYSRWAVNNNVTYKCGSDKLKIFDKLLVHSTDGGR
jgi:hypothetical protein